MRPVTVLAFFALAALPALADRETPIPWWRLETSPRSRPAGTEPVAFRTLEEARSGLSWTEGEKTLAPAVLERVAWETHMVVAIPVTGPAGSEWDVESAVRNCKALHIRGVFQPGAAKDSFDTVVLLLMPQTDAPLFVEWREGTLGGMRAGRDCDPAAHSAYDDVVGRCSWCGGRSPAQAGKYCPECGRKLQRCWLCGKRAAGEPPLKQEEKK